MSHGESCAGVVGGAVGVGGHKKLRRKRKELDALVPEDKVRRKSSSASHHDLLRSDSEDPEADYAGVGVITKRVMGGDGGSMGGLWACLPGACTLLLLLTTLVGVAAALRLLMLTRRDLDSLHTRISSVEASSSELPAKFHESHVRLQELEKNQTALLVQVSEVSANLVAATKRVEQLEADAKTIKDSLNSAPHLSSLPKDVSDLQGSVATFGSTLQDVQSSLKVVKQEHEKLQSDVQQASSSINNFRHELSVLHNQTTIEGGGGEEGGSGATLSETISKLRHQVEALNSVVSSVNSSLISHVDDSRSAMQNLENLSQSKEGFHNVSKRVATLENWRKTIDPDLTTQISNLSTITTQLQSTSEQQEHLLQNLTQSMAVVKGVERKLEGSQVQLASGVSDIKQQLEKVEQKVVTMEAANSTPAPPASNETHTRKQRLIQAGKERDGRGP